MKVRRDIFHAISDPVRRSILSQLLKGPLAVGEVAEKFAVTRQAVSLHMQILEECKVITIEKRGRERLCRLAPASFGEISGFIEPFLKMWHTRLDQLESLLNNPKENINETTSE